MVHNPSIALLALALAAGGARAQSVLGEFFGNQSVEEVGFSVAGGEDFDADGWDDVVVGSPFRNAAGLSNNGAVKVLSGRDGSTIHLKVGDSDQDWFGWEVALCGDVDGDGVRDVIVGAPNAALLGAGRPGMARVFSGRTSATLYTVWGDTDGDLFGHAVGGGLDHDGDGLAEFVVGAPNADYFGSGPRGAVRVFDGATGAQVVQSTSAYPDAQWGWAVSCRSDLDGDGTRDIAIGAPGGSPAGAGQVNVVSGASLLAIAEWWGPSVGSRFGAAVGGGLDLGGDGQEEVLVGAPREGTGGVDAGWVGLYGSGGLARHWLGDAAGDDLGTAVTSIADVDGDGVRDVLIGAPQATSGGRGYARLCSAVSGTERYTVGGRDPGDMFGYDVAWARDFNDDGVGADFVVGARLSVSPGGLLTGSARVHSGAGPGLVSYCTAGTSASGCQALIAGTGTPSASASAGFLLSATGAEGGKSGIFFYGPNGRQASPWGNGTSLQCVVPPVKRGGLLPGVGSNGTCDGIFVQDLNARWCPSCPKPNHNFGAGAIVQAQLWYRDPGNTSNQTTSLSNALEFVLQP